MSAVKAHIVNLGDQLQNFRAGSELKVEKPPTSNKASSQQRQHAIDSEKNRIAALKGWKVPKKEE